MNTDKSIQVSVICITYNHVRYIKDALEGIINQKTDFSFEVIVHDDASEDGTADIIREYAGKYPDIIKPILQKENMYRKRIPKYINFIEPLVRGKYLAFCEGDDYWTDENKLQTQYSIMENNPECVMCTHSVKSDRINNGIMMEYPNPQVQTGIYNCINALKLPYMQTSSYFLRASSYKEYNFCNLRFAKVAGVGDEPMLLYYRQLGPVFHLNKPMSFYRYRTMGSWSSRHVSLEAQDQDTDNLIAMYKEFDIFTQNKYSNFCDERILHLEFKKLNLHREFKQMHNIRYRSILRQYSVKYRLLVSVGCYFPSIATKLLNKKAGNNNG